MNVVHRRKRKSFFSGLFHAVVSVIVVGTVYLWNRLIIPGTPSHDPSPLELPSNAKKEVADLVQVRLNEILNKEQIPGGYPPLSSLVEAVASHGKESKSEITLRIIGNVQFLLDYAIVGFSKCGTTTLLKWILRDPDVRTFQREIHEILQEKNPGDLVDRLYQNLLENPINGTATNKGFLQGFKNPEILQVPMALRHLNTYWPETKLIVSVRNPLKWFRSFYNFRLAIGHLQQVGTDPNALIGHCHNGGKMLCSRMGAFHVKLFRMGKTTMSSSGELELLRPFLAQPDEGDDRDIWDHINGATSLLPMKNKIFFLELRQLSDSNRTRAGIFRKDLENFLGLRHELSRVFRARPFQHLELTLDEEAKRHKMDSICNPKYLPLQADLFRMAQKSSLWIRNYFLKSHDVTVSSPEHVESLLATWMQNPCYPESQAQALKV